MAFSSSVVVTYRGLTRGVRLTLRTYTSSKRTARAVCHACLARNEKKDGREKDRRRDPAFPSKLTSSFKRLPERVSRAPALSARARRHLSSRPSVSARLFAILTILTPPPPRSSANNSPSHPLPTRLRRRRSATGSVASVSVRPFRHWHSLLSALDTHSVSSLFLAPPPVFLSSSLSLSVPLMGFRFCMCAAYAKEAAQTFDRYAGTRRQTRAITIVK